jgi:hypothetical protein
MKTTRATNLQTSARTLLRATLLSWRYFLATRLLKVLPRRIRCGRIGKSLWTLTTLSMLREAMLTTSGISSTTSRTLEFSGKNGPPSSQLLSCELCGNVNSSCLTGEFRATSRKAICTPVAKKLSPSVAYERFSHACPR